MTFAEHEKPLPEPLLAVCERYAHLIATLVATKDLYSDVFKRLRRRRPMTVASEGVGSRSAASPGHRCVYARRAPGAVLRQRRRRLRLRAQRGRDPASGRVRLHAARARGCRPGRVCLGGVSQQPASRRRTSRNVRRNGRRGIRAVPDKPVRYGNDRSTRRGFRGGCAESTPGTHPRCC